METLKINNDNRIEETQNFLESKKINSFQAVKEFFKNVFLDFIAEVDSSTASFTEKKHEIHFYSGESSMAVIDQDDKIAIWRLDHKAGKIIAILDFEAGFSFVKYVNPVRIAYLCEDEIKEIFARAFKSSAVLH